MNLRNGLLILASVVVAGVVIAGQTIGWDKFLIPIFQRPNIIMSSTIRQNTKKFLANEKIWLSLTNVETDRVYWLFDEGDNLIRGGVQIQHSFDFNSDIPEGTEHYRRVDAFYKAGNQYETTTVQVAINNFQINAAITIEPEVLKLTADSNLSGGWKISSVSLAKYDEGQFEDVQVMPVSFSTDGQESNTIWSLVQAGVAFGYNSVEDFTNNLSVDEKAWVSVTYSPAGVGEPLTLVKQIQEESP